MPGPLALPSLEIHNFRGLRELKIARLGRANLIVGKNNVGKTSVLEALRIYASLPPSKGILEVLGTRRELYEVSESHTGKLHDRFLPIRSLFYGRQFFPDVDQPSIKIGPTTASEQTLTLSARFLFNNVKGTIRSKNADGKEEEVVDGGLGHIALVFDSGGAKKYFPIDDAAEFQRLSNLWESSRADRTGFELTTVWLGSRDDDSESIQNQWSRIALSDNEDELIECLKLIEPAIERVNLIPASEFNRELTPFVRLRGNNEPIYLGSLGEGANRLFSLGLGLLNASDGVMLIDEIENGLHYTTLRDVWRFIFRVAAKLDVQVFATTHSSDCVEAFQAAASESEEEGVLIRLARKGDRILVGEYDEALLEKAVDGGVEVR